MVSNQHLAEATTNPHPTDQQSMSFITDKRCQLTCKYSAFISFSRKDYTYFGRSAAHRLASRLHQILSITNGTGEKNCFLGFIINASFVARAEKKLLILCLEGFLIIA